jgi:outer membrane protein assembly factor BamB
MRKVLGAALLLAGLGASARSDDWPAWRGPKADGTAAGTPPLTWGEGKNVRWKADLPGKGSATPVVWGDQVFVLTAEKSREAKPDELPARDPRFQIKPDPPGHFYKFIVLSFDRNTGKPRWSHVAAEKVPHEGHHTSHSYAAGSPTTDGKRLYVAFGSFGVFAYDLTGKPLWSRDLGRLHTRLGWGEAVTPVVHGDYLLLNRDQEADSKLVCLDAATGQTRWEAPRDEKSSWNTPLVVRHNGADQVIVNGTNRIRAHDLATGKELWSVGGMTVNPIPSAVTDGEVVYVMSGYQGAAAVAVKLGGSGKLDGSDRVVWRYAKGTPYVPSPLLYDGRLYFTEANAALLTVLDAKTGKPLVDRERLPGVSAFYASPVGAAGRVYLVDRGGTTLVLKAGDAVEVLATNKLDDRIDASPAVAGKQLFLRGEKHLYCIEER